MDLSLILLLVLAAVAVFAGTLWKKSSALESGLRAETRLLEEKKDEAEKARREARERRDELEGVKKELQDAKLKLKKREKEEQPKVEKKKAPPGVIVKREAEEPAAPGPVIVRISDQELSAEHQRAVQKLEDELTALRSELAASKMREESRLREAEKAAKALEMLATAPTSTPAPAAPVQEAPKEQPKESGEELAAARAQLDGMRRAAGDRERELRRDLRKAQDEIKHAMRRAANTQAMYAVLKGQLELAEDRIAAYHLKYENAKSIDELRREQKKDRPKKQRDNRDNRRDQAQQPQGEQPAQEQAQQATPPAPPPPDPTGEQPVSQVPNASTIEVSNQDIVSQHPIPVPEIVEPENKPSS